MTNTEIKYTIRRTSAILSTCLDTIFHWPPQIETLELCERLNALLEVTKRDVDNLLHAVSDCRSGGAIRTAAIDR